MEGEGGRGRTDGGILARRFISLRRREDRGETASPPPTDRATVPVAPRREAQLHFLQQQQQPRQRRRSSRTEGVDGKVKMPAKSAAMTVWSNASSSFSSSRVMYTWMGGGTEE